MRAASLRHLVVAGLWSALAATGGDIPRPAPDFPIPMPDGRILRPADYKGKVVVVEFLLTTCPACQNAAHILSRLQGEYGPKGLVIIGVAINAGAERLVGGFMANHATTFPVGVRNEDAARAYLQIPIMNRLLFPQLVFIDRNGVIRSHRGGGNDETFFADEEKNLRLEIERLLKEPAKNTAASKRPIKK